MEDNKISPQSIWGTWWTDFRKWFYPTWLIYETSIRFFEYSLPVHQYFISQMDSLGKGGAQFSATLCSSLTFAICFFFLTVPATVALFRYFNNNTITGHSIEQKIKTFL